MIKCKDCKLFSQMSEDGGICGFSSFGTVSIDYGCKSGDIVNSVYKHGENQGIKKSIEKLEEYKNEKMVDTYVVKECIDVLKRFYDETNKS